ncbi:unnamed protein product [Phytomonas sp. Hart1]|nr:unnamed protein product [Phytomonas sp. Hart1]|eukprot:CCW67615.1 unnamed protein product [Phytomonas sp. isolate Hart1]
MGCCHSRKRTPNGEDPSVAPKSKKAVSAKHRKVKPTPSSHEQTAAMEAEEQEKRLAQRDHLEAQRREQELQRLHGQENSIPYHPSPTTAEDPPEDAEKPKMELSGLLQPVAQPTDKIDTPPTEVVPSKSSPSPMEEDNSLYSEAEGEGRTGLKDVALPLAEPSSAGATPPKDSSTEIQMNSDTPFSPPTGPLNELENEDCNSPINGNETDIEHANSGGNETEVVAEHKPIDFVKGVDLFSPNSKNELSAILNGKLNESQRAWSTATIEEVLSPYDKQQRQLLLMEEFHDMGSDHTLQDLNDVQIIMRRLPPPPSPTSEGDPTKKIFQIQNDETEKTQETEGCVIPIKEVVPLLQVSPNSSIATSQVGVELAEVVVGNKEGNESLAV